MLGKLTMLNYVKCIQNMEQLLLDKMLRDWNVKGPVHRSVPAVGDKAPNLRVEDFAHTSKVPGIMVLSNISH